MKEEKNHVTISADAKRAFDKISGPFTITLSKLQTGDTLSVRQGISKNPTADAIAAVKRPRPPSLSRSSQHRPVAQASDDRKQSKSHKQG